MNNKKEIKNLSLEHKIIIISILFLFVIVVNAIIYVNKMGVGYSIKNVLNNSESLTKEHCLDNICINNLNIYYTSEKEGPSSVSGMMKNNSDETMDACVKIKLIVPGREETADFNICFFDLGAGEEVPIETYFKEDQNYLIHTSDYELDHLNDAELKRLYDAREKDENH